MQTQKEAWTAGVMKPARKKREQPSYKNLWLALKEQNNLLLGRIRELEKELRENERPETKKERIKRDLKAVFDSIVEVLED